jgi:hypothetical protein
MLENIEDIALIPEPTDKRLEPTQKVRYRQFRKRFREWLHTIGKNPGRGEGYALTTIKSRMYRADKFFRWVWANETDGFTVQITTAHADAFMEHLAKSDQGRSYKADLQKAVKAYFRFDGTEWEPQIAFSDPSRPSVAKSVLTPDEWRRVREAAASYGARIDYRNVTPAERAAMNEVLAERLGKPVSKVGPDDWKDAPSFKLRITCGCGWKTASASRSTLMCRTCG